MNEYETFVRLHDRAHGLYIKNNQLEQECNKMEDQMKTYRQEIEGEAKRVKVNDGSPFILSN